ncbi:hypothetical protein EZS27_007161 [termite gut metagenome]|uniref:Uncharacterized protein n=1 Tax=termite gut metagenome TaxID=433724 RepID=A0A5J4SJ23_9ZZZZ
MIIATPRLKLQSIKSLTTYLEIDLRFEMSALGYMDATIINQCIKVGKKKDVLNYC